MKPKPAIQKKELQKTAYSLQFSLPPGTQLSDMFIDGAQVIAELFISKRTLLNWRRSGKISYCDLFGKIFYYKQEIAQILLEGKKRAGKENISRSADDKLSQGVAILQKPRK